MFTIKKNIEKVVPVVLTVEQKNLITDLYISTGGNVVRTKHEMGNIRVSNSLIGQEFARKVEIFNYVKQVMVGKILVSPEENHIDNETDETVIDKEAVYNTIPKTSTDLKTELSKWFDEDKTVLDYIIDKIVKYADGTDKCAWNKFELMFKKGSKL